LDDIKLPSNDCPNFYKTKSIAESESPFLGRRLRIKISSNNIVNPGWLSSDYALFHVETYDHTDERSLVNRRDSDFYFLRKLLRHHFPCIVIPPLPKQKTKLVEKSLAKRQKFFERFLQGINRSEVLKSSPFFAEFLTEKDEKKFERLVKNTGNALVKVKTLSEY